jgi:hypothetical protein
MIKRQSQATVPLKSQILVIDQKDIGTCCKVEAVQFLLLYIPSFLAFNIVYFFAFRQL